MKSMKGEVLLNIPSEKAWEMYRDNEIISKINPEIVEGATYVQGDGNVGSVRFFKLGPAVANYVKESMEKIERVEKGRSVTYRVIGGDLSNIYDPYRVTFSFIPIKGKEIEQCMVKWEVDFEPLTSVTPPPNQARDAALGFFKSFDKFQLSC